MPKTKTQYVCKNCGAKSFKWQGKCTLCGEWNTFLEETIESGKTEERGRKLAKSSESVDPVSLSEIEVSDGFRLNTGINEFDRVLGGGIVPG